MHTHTHTQASVNQGVQSLAPGRHSLLYDFDCDKGNINPGIREVSRRGCERGKVGKIVRKINCVILLKKSFKKNSGNLSKGTNSTEART